MPWWNAFRANIGSRDMVDLQQDFASCFLLIEPDARRAVFDYAVDELRRLRFPEQAFERLQRFSNRVFESCSQTEQV